jgi:hypothetical protein
MDKRFGPAGPGSAYHHIVEQGGANSINFPPELINSPKNIARIPSWFHVQISAVYSRTRAGGTMTVREWLGTKSFDFQYRYGLKLMREFGILK